MVKRWLLIELIDGCRVWCPRGSSKSPKAVPPTTDQDQEKRDQCAITFCETPSSTSCWTGLTRSEPGRFARRDARAVVCCTVRATRASRAGSRAACAGPMRGDEVSAAPRAGAGQLGTVPGSAEMPCTAAHPRSDIGGAETQQATEPDDRWQIATGGVAVIDRLLGKTESSGKRFRGELDGVNHDGRSNDIHLGRLNGDECRCLADHG